MNAFFEKSVIQCLDSNSDLNRSGNLWLSTTGSDRVFLEIKYFEQHPKRLQRGDHWNSRTKPNIDETDLHFGISKLQVSAIGCFPIFIQCLHLGTTWCRDLEKNLFLWLPDFSLVHC